MKKLLLFIMLLPFVAWSQEITLRSENLFTEWGFYLQDCNELVADTVNQYGIVKVNLIPVKMDGKIMSYAIEPKDTVWDDYKCADYKHYSPDGFYIRNINTTSGGSSLGSVTLAGTISGSLGYYSEKLYTPESTAVTEYRIERNVICKVKKCKASFEDFWNRWCVEKKLIQFN